MRRRSRHLPFEPSVFLSFHVASMDPHETSSSGPAVRAVQTLNLLYRRDPFAVSKKIEHHEPRPNWNDSFFFATWSVVICVDFGRWKEVKLQSSFWKTYQTKVLFSQKEMLVYKAQGFTKLSDQFDWQPTVSSEIAQPRRHPMGFEEVAKNQKGYIFTHDGCFAWIANWFLELVQDCSSMAESLNMTCRELKYSLRK